MLSGGAGDPGAISAPLLTSSDGAGMAVTDWPSKHPGLADYD